MRPMFHSQDQDPKMLRSNDRRDLELFRRTQNRQCTRRALRRPGDCGFCSDHAQAGSCGHLKSEHAAALGNSSLFAFAGLWDAWKDKDGHWLQSYAIVTTEANELMTKIHPRMPVILHTRDYDRWLDREETERLPIDLLRPFESEEMEVYEANPKVGNVRNNGPEMMRVAAKAAEAGDLPL